MKKFLLAILLLLCASPAFAWNCSNPLSARVPVPAGTTGSFGDGDGQLFLGTGTEGVKGQLYECKVPTPVTPPTKSKGDPIYQNQTQSQTISSNSSSNSNATANSAANSKSSSSATGGSSTSTASGGSATVTGVSSAVKNSGNSTLTNSGNSSNTNTNTAQGGSGGSASSTASGNGDGSNNTTNNTTSNTVVEASKIPVATALAVAPPATSPCVVGFGGGVQTMAFGGSISGGKIDKNCAILETARSFASMNARLAYCKTMLINKFAKQAGITLEDCMKVPVQAAIAPVIQAPPSPVTPTPIVINLPPPAAIVPAIQPVKSEGTLQDLGSFRVTRSYSTNLCPTIQTILGPGGVQILNRAVTLSANGEVILIGNVYTTAVATSYLRKHGVSKVTIRAADEQDSSVGVQIWSAQ